MTGAILGWLLRKGPLGYARFLWAGGAVLALLAALTAYKVYNAGLARENRKIGAQIQREADLNETIRRVEQANDIERKIQEDIGAGYGIVVYDQCLRANRGPSSNCERFLPKREDD